MDGPFCWVGGCLICTTFNRMQSLPNNILIVVFKFLVGGFLVCEGLDRGDCGLKLSLYVGSHDRLMMYSSPLLALFR